MNVTDFQSEIALHTGAKAGIGSVLMSNAEGLGMRISLADADMAAIEQRSHDLSITASTPSPSGRTGPTSSVPQIMDWT